MVKVYAVTLSIGVIGLLVMILGDGLAENLGRAADAPSNRWGRSGRMWVAGAVGFGMGGMSAEFSPLGIGWPVALGIAAVAAAAAALWAGSALAGDDHP